MSRTERIYRIAQMLDRGGVVSRQVFLQELEVSLATLKRDLEYMRDRLSAPIEWDASAGGYRFAKAASGTRYELPGVWFSSSEIIALLSLRELLNSLGPGLLTAQIEPVLDKMKSMLSGDECSPDAFDKRIRILQPHAHTYQAGHFAPVAAAVMRRRRMLIEHYSKVRNTVSRREISPQRLTHYRENWYIDAFCHLRNDIRCFSLGSVQSVQLLDVDAVEIDDAELASVLDSGYGIFAGREVNWAELMFSGGRARWVSHERWHPEQQSWFGPSGEYHLRVPYTDDTEVSMEILRHVPEVVVVGPDALRNRVEALLREGLARIAKGGSAREPAVRDNGAIVD